jgi:hypothetical protein
MIQDINCKSLSIFRFKAKVFYIHVSFRDVVDATTLEKILMGTSITTPIRTPSSGTSTCCFSPIRIELAQVLLSKNSCRQSGDKNWQNRGRIECPLGYEGIPNPGQPLSFQG